MSIIRILWLSVPINSCMCSPLWQDADVSPEHDPMPIASGYSYCIRIILPKSKKNFLVLDMHNTTQRFQTPLELKTKLWELFANHVPHNLENMQVGYFRAQKKKWIDSEVDLSAMYSHFHSGDEILLWCDGCDLSPNAVEKPTGKIMMKHLAGDCIMKMKLTSWLWNWWSFMEISILTLHTRYGWEWWRTRSGIKWMIPHQ